MDTQPTGIMELIANAQWREAVTYRETWPHEYVVIQRDGQTSTSLIASARFSRHLWHNEAVSDVNRPVPLVTN